MIGPEVVSILSQGNQMAWGRRAVGFDHLMNLKTTSSIYLIFIQNLQKAFYCVGSVLSSKKCGSYKLVELIIKEVQKSAQYSFKTIPPTTQKMSNT